MSRGGLARERATARGVLLMLGSMALLACMDAVSKRLAEDYAIPQILWVRYLVFAGLGVLLCRRIGVRRAWRSSRPGLQLFRSLLQICEIGVFVLAFTYLPLADAHAIAACSPLLVVALSAPLLGERVGPARWGAVLVGFAGVLLIIRPGFQELGPGVLVALFAALLWAVYQILLRLVSRTDRSETTLLWSGVVGAVVLTALGPFVWRAPDAVGWGLLLLLSAFGAAAHLLLIKALEASPASALQPFSYALLVSAAIVGFVSFGDIPDAWTIAGAAVVVASGLFAFQRERRAGRLAGAINHAPNDAAGDATARRP
jgi:drug/metabolite transporter (DMT)-like permease